MIVTRDGSKRVIGWIHKGGCENPACLDAMSKGRMFHAIPAGFAVTLPTYHYPTRHAAASALRETEEGIA